MVLTGLTMSPGFNAFFPWPAGSVRRPAIGPQHPFHLRRLIVLFVIVHLVEVMLAGPINEVRSMLTGWYRIPKDHD